MFAAAINSTKSFMSHILKKETFDNLCVVSVDITTFASFNINGSISGASSHASYCLWRDIKPYVYTIIKGKTLPKSMKIVLAASPELASSFSSINFSFFINIRYDSSGASVTTGAFSREFSLDQTPQLSWDEYVKTFLFENEIYFTENE